MGKLLGVRVAGEELGRGCKGVPGHTPDDVLQADNGNYSLGIVPLMACHLHISWGILHVQSRSVVGTSQEIPNVSSQALQSQAQPLPGQRSRGLQCVAPRFSPNQACAFKNTTLLIQSLNVQVEHSGLQGGRESLG